MPTVILLDTSLSMCRPVPEDSRDMKIASDVQEVILRKDLAAKAINKILDHFTQTNKLEFVSLVIYSYLNEIAVGFTRDYSAIRSYLHKVPDQDKSMMNYGLNMVVQYCKEEWGNSTPCQVIVVTDGSPGVGYQQNMKTAFGPRTQQNLAMQYSALASLDILCMASEHEYSFQSSLSLYQKYVELNGNGSVHVVKGHLNEKNLMVTVGNMLTSQYSPYKGTLHCGQLSTQVTLCPPPHPFTSKTEGSSGNRTSISDQITVLGFIAIVDASSPPAFSRHLLLPTSDKDEGSGESNGEEEPDEGKVPNLCVLIHGGLKKESLVALCRVATDWYGILYSWSDNKKKSNLLLSIFEPGNEVIPWLGSLAELGPPSMHPSGDSAPTFPVKTGEKRSYNQPCVVWVRAGGLQSDVQKILRHARKLPDKTNSFYKELNRVRRAALQYGFPDLLLGICSVLERDMMGLPSNAHPEVAMQLQHACQSLRACAKDANDPNNKDTKHHANIQPLKTSYAVSD